MRRRTYIAAAVLVFAATGGHAADKLPQFDLPQFDLPSLLGGAAAAVLAALAWSRKFLKGWTADGATIETIQLLRDEVGRLSEVNSRLAQEVGRLHDQNIRLQGEIEQLHRRFAQIDERKAPRAPAQLGADEALNEAATRG